jgi:intergrase/recombinase
MGKLGVADRFIDVFQGRSPRNVLAKHYTHQRIGLLREIYDKADLKVI